jgi:hypothetical protein
MPPTLNTTLMEWAALMVDRRWAITREVRPHITRSRAACRGGNSKQGAAVVGPLAAEPSQGEWRKGYP